MIYWGVTQKFGNLRPQADWETTSVTDNVILLLEILKVGDLGFLCHYIWVRRKACSYISIYKI